MPLNAGRPRELESKSCLCQKVVSKTLGLLIGRDRRMRVLCLVGWREWALKKEVEKLLFIGTQLSNRHTAVDLTSRSSLSLSLALSAYLSLGYCLRAWRAFARPGVPGAAS